MCSGLPLCFCVFVCFFKQKTAYEMRSSDWSSDVCSSDLFEGPVFTLANPESAKWATISRDAAVLPVGRDNALDLVGGAPACVDRITLADGRALTWKPAGGDRLTVTLPAPPAAPDPLTPPVHPQGGGEAVRVRPAERRV